MTPEEAALAGIDLEALRLERLAHLQAAMRARDLSACLLFSEPNTRYATGASAMPIWAMSTFTRCAVVPAEGTPILFEHGNSVHRSRLRTPDVRPMHAWEFYDDPAAQARVFAGEAVDALRELGVTGGRIGVDRLGTPGYAALAGAGLELVDSAPATQAAREVKTPQEIALFRLNGRLMTEALGEFEAAIRPGIRERELFAELAASTLGRGAEFQATSTVCSGPEHEPVARRGDRARDRARRSRLARHRHRGHRGLLLLRVAGLRLSGRAAAEPRGRSTRIAPRTSGCSG